MESILLAKNYPINFIETKLRKYNNKNIRTDPQVYISNENNIIKLAEKTQNLCRNLRSKLSLKQKTL